MKIVAKANYDKVLELWKLRMERFCEVEDGRLKLFGVETSLVFMEFLLTFIVALDKYLATVGWNIMLNFGRQYGYNYSRKYIENWKYTKEEVMKSVPYMLWVNGLGNYEIEYLEDRIIIRTSKKNPILIYEGIVNPFVLGYIIGILEAIVGNLQLIAIEPGEEIVFKLQRSSEERGFFK